MGMSSTSRRFEKKFIGKINIGLRYDVICNLVKFRDVKGKFRFHADLRLHSFSVERVAHCASIKGITLSKDMVLNLYNDMLRLPIDCPKMEDKEFIKIKEYTKRLTTKIVLSISSYKGKNWIDIREYVCESSTGYNGPTFRGTRVHYEQRAELSDVLMKCYNEMLDLEKKPLDFGEKI